MKSSKMGAFTLSLLVACHSRSIGGATAGSAGANIAGTTGVAAAMSGNAAVTNQDGTSGEGAAAGETGASCEAVDDVAALGVASVSLNASQPSFVSETVKLRGDGLVATLDTQQNLTAGLRWQNDRMFLLTDKGFWDIPVQGPGRWYPTSTLLVSGVRADDVDADGDQDMMLLTSELNPAGPDPKTGSPLLSRLAVWERTDDGLHEHPVASFAEMLLFLAFDFGDVDGDGDLDVVSYEHGTPVSYVNDGAFGFTRTLLGATAPQYEGMLVGLIDYADRDQDGSQDLVVLAGEALDVEAFVLLGDGTGKLRAPGPATKAIAALVPHGPMGSGFGIADVTGDGLADILIQDPSGTDTAPILRMYASENAISFKPAVAVTALDFEFADVDRDGRTDIVSTLDRRAIALISKGAGAFEARDLGIDMTMPPMKDYVVEPGQGDAPAILHVLYGLPACPACGPRCAGRCIFDSCVACLSDTDCGAGRCVQRACVP